MSESRFAFGAFRLDTGGRALYRGLERMPLTPKAVDTLIALVRRAGALVTTQELRASVWPATSVGEGSLARNVSDLRKALGGRSRGEYIETVAKRGYRFVARVRRVPERESSRVQPLWLAVRATSRSRESRRACLRLEEALLAKLRSAGALAVRTPSRTSRAAREGLAVSLRAARTRGRLRVAVELVAGRGPPVWAEVIEHTGDAFATEQEVAEQIAGAVSLWLAKRRRRPLSRRYTESAEAYQLYLQGQLHAASRSEASLRAAAILFERALAIDPEYALAYAGLARVLALLPMSAPVASADCMPRARAAAANALAIDDTLHDARAVLAFVRWHYQWDWSSADRELRRIIRFQPSDVLCRQWRGLVLAEQGRFSLAIEELTCARELAPTSQEVQSTLATVLHLAGEYESALGWARRALDSTLPPIRARLVAGWALEQLGRRGESIHELELAIEAAPTAPALIGALGHVTGVLAGPTRVEPLLARLDRLPPPVTHYSRALIASAIGNTGEALRALHAAVEHRDFQVVLLRVDPRFAALRRLPAYREVARAIRARD
jgi:DNA-binding winged helix-turn-helix (wHTH) protein/Tfp pilus assembly protein PilF